MKYRSRNAVFGAAVLLGTTTSALADKAAEPMPPVVIPHGHKDISFAPSGTYTLDPNHMGVIVKVSHLGFSLSVFRFDRATATLDWNHDAPSKSKLNATVATSSIASNVAGFAAQLIGDKYLNAAAHPSATFVSSAFRQTDATHGKVDGQFTLMGHTKPASFDVTLVGAGSGFAGGPVMGHVIGVEAVTAIDPQAYGLPAIFAEPIEITIDAEFDHPEPLKPPKLPKPSAPIPAILEGGPAARPHA